jgi:hypothetical protein
MVQKSSNKDEFKGYEVHLTNSVGVVNAEAARDRKKWRTIGGFVLLTTLACWATAATLTYGIAFRGVSIYWAPFAAIAGFSGEVCLVIALSLFGFKQFTKRFEALKLRWQKLRNKRNGRHH